MAGGTRKGQLERQREQDRSGHKKKGYRGPVRKIKFVRPWLYPKQYAFLYCEQRYSICEAATKTGKTAGCIIWLAEQAAINGGPNRNFWWVAPSYSQAEIAFRRMLQYCPQQYAFPNYSALTIRFANGARIWFKSGERPDSLYGEDVYACVIDEASRCREQAFIAIRSTVTATRAPVRIIGNVKGRKNWAYKLARRAEAAMASGGPSNLYWCKLTAYDAVDAGIFPASEIDDARSVMPEEAFNELYLAIPTEDGANPFGVQNLKDCAMPKLATGPAICYGVDIARKKDWTVIVGLNRAMQVCYFERFQRSWPDTENAIALVCKNKPTLIDATGVGDPIEQHLASRMTGIEGFVFGNRSKQDLMENLAMRIQNKQVGIPANSVLMQELLDFEYEHKPNGRGIAYSAPEGLYDDAVCALALAVWHFGKGLGPAVKPYSEPVYAPFETYAVPL